MGPVGVGKTFLANTLGHIAVRSHHSVHTKRADKRDWTTKRVPLNRTNSFGEVHTSAESMPVHSNDAFAPTQS
ncbi:ATP-binding protein [Mycobacterium paragordonae]|uniref:ATP-binding protein n=1 Tax=Mycobacterium paragordonae TaxID=1389713 RepID=A0AAJ1W6R5_9MYCO|nr:MULTISPECIES: ATP-binding protein [Mycobacterium]MDP7739473.1 ATP-binding protein [Mycobacterium paragordonae]